MSYVFKYFDGSIYRNDAFYVSYSNFITNNPNFPIDVNQWFEYRGSGDFDTINSEGHHNTESNLEPYLDLIYSIHGFNAAIELDVIVKNRANHTGSQPISTITSLQASLDGKANLSHAHVITDVTGLESELAGKAAATHTHAISEVNGLQSALDAKQAALTAQAHIADAATNAPTNLNVITTLLGTLTGQLNDTNTRYNDLATKFNTLLLHLETQGLQLTS